MQTPDGPLSGAQLEVMNVLWAGPPGGMRTSEVWREVRKSRDIARTTVLTVLQRLEVRGWVRRGCDEKVVSYEPVFSRDEVSANLAAGLIDEHFEGSAARLISSLLGTRHANPAELDRLRKLLDQRDRDRG